MEFYTIKLGKIYDKDCSYYISNQENEIFEALIESVEWNCLADILCVDSEITVYSGKHCSRDFYIAKLVFLSLKNDYLTERALN